MKNHKEFRFRTLLCLVLVVVFSAVMAAQNEGATPTTESSTNGLLERRLAHIPPHAGQASAADKQTQTPSTGLERTLLPSHARSSRDKSPHAVSPLSLRPLDSLVAAERYVFGRMDLATGDSPLGAAVGTFQTGGPPSLAIPNYYGADPPRQSGRNLPDPSRLAPDCILQFRDSCAQTGLEKVSR
jgi:hypothetical protein